jgi:hypothetical protein
VTSLLALAPAPRATAAVTYNADAISVATDPDQQQRMIKSSERETDGLYYRVFATNGANVEQAYPTPERQRVEVTYVLQSLTSTGWAEVATSPTQHTTAHLGLRTGTSAYAFDLPYDATTRAATYRIVYRASWYLADASEAFRSVTLLPDDGASSCTNTVLTCTPQEQGTLSVSGIRFDNGALSVSSSPWGDRAMIASAERESGGLFYRTLYTAGATVGQAYPSQAGQRVEVSYVLQTLDPRGGWAEVQRTAPRSLTVARGATASAGVDYFQLPYESTYALATFRIVYQARWYVPGSADPVSSVTLLPDRTGASACYNVRLACLTRDYGRVTVF